MLPSTDSHDTASLPAPPIKSNYERKPQKVVPAIQTLVTLELRQFAIYVTEHAPPIPRGLKTCCHGVNTNILTMNRKTDRPDMTIAVYQACED